MKRSSDVSVKVFTAAISAVLLLCAPSAYGQMVAGSMVGTISDASGGVVPGATVTVTNVETNVSRVTTTDPSGNYSVPNLPPGSYKVSAERQGFAVGVRTDVGLFGDATLRIDIALSPGLVTQAVTVNASAAAMLQTETAQTGRALNTMSVEDLPLNQGHNFQNLLQLAPGAEPAIRQHSSFNNPQNGVSSPANGIPSRFNGFNIEGITDNQHSGYEPVFVPAMESIQEVNIIGSNYDPALGAALGAVTNVIIKSGTNTFHGEVYEFYTGNKLDSRNFFANVGTGGGPYKLANVVDNYFGGNFGGPIQKNKTFFFVDLYYHPTTTGSFYSLSVPTAAMRQGNFTDPFLPVIYDPTTGDEADCLPGGNAKLCGTGRTQINTGGAPNTMTIDPVAQKLLSHVLLPNANLNATGKALYTNNLLINSPFVQNTPNLDIKIDRYQGEHDHISGRLGWMDPKTSQAGLYGDYGGPIGVAALPGVEGHALNKIWSTGINWVHFFSPTLLMEARVGISRYNNIGYPAGYGEDLATQVGVPGVNIDAHSSGLFGVYGEGFSDPLVGTNGGYPYFHAQDNIIFMDHWTKIRGNHTLTFGMDYYRIRDDYNYLSYQGGYFGFCAGTTSLNGGTAGNFANQFASFLLSDPCSEQQGHVNSFPTFRQNQFYPYFGDKWQATKKLTVNLGVRWEDYAPPTSHFPGGLSNYVPQNNTLTLNGIGSTPSNEGVHPDYRNWGPRVGLAYRLTDHEVLRAGFGMSSIAYPLDIYITNYPISPLNTWGTLSSYGPAILNDGTAGTFEKGYAPLVPYVPPANGIIPVTGALKNLSMVALDLNWRQPYVVSWNAAFERTLPGQWILDIAYVGNRNVHAPILYNLNAATAYGQGAAGQPEFSTYGRTASTTQYFAQFRNAYDSLQVKMDHRFAHNFSITSSYTWGKSIGYADEAGDYISGFNDYVNLRRNYAPTDFNIASMLSQSVIWMLPMGKGMPYLSSGIGEKVLGGWELSGVLLAHTGFPLNFGCTCPAFNTPGNNAYPNEAGPISVLHGINPSPWFNTGNFSVPAAGTQGNVGSYVDQGPGFFNLDAALSRTITITERFKLLLRTEWSHATNTPQFANPNTSLGSSSFGLLTSATGQRTIDIVGKLTF